MRAIFTMVRKDLLRKVRQPLGVAVLLAFPLVFSLMLALAFGTGDDAMPRIRLLVENQDEGILGDLLLSAFTSEEFAKHFDAQPAGADALERMRAGEASALLRIPAGLTQALLDGTPAKLELVRNPSESILPEIAEQGAVVLAEVLSAASRVLRVPLDQLRPLLEGDSGPSDVDIAAIAVSANTVVRRAETFLFPPAITLEADTLPGGNEAGGSPSTAASIFLVILPGISVYALFMLGDIAMRDLLTEAGAHTLHRQLAGPVGAGRVILAKALFTAVLSLISLLILATVAWSVADAAVDIAGFAVLGLSVVAAVTGASAVIYGASSNPRGGATIGSLLYLILGFGSGSFVPLQSLPVARQLAPFSPFYWATQGFLDLLQKGAGLADLMPNVAVLGATGAVLLAVGSALLHRQVARGLA